MGGGSGTGSEGTRQAWSLQFVGLGHELVGFGQKTRHDDGDGETSKSMRMVE
jgi:hypothetical protein